MSVSYHACGCYILPLSVLLWFNVIGQIDLLLNLCYPFKFHIFQSFHNFTQLLFLVLCGPWLMFWTLGLVLDWNFYLDAGSLHLCLSQLFSTFIFNFSFM
jgi:hypothetical protein